MRVVAAAAALNKGVAHKVAKVSRESFFIGLKKKKAAGLPASDALLPSCPEADVRIVVQQRGRALFWQQHPRAAIPIITKSLGGIAQNIHIVLAHEGAAKGPWANTLHRHGP